MTEKKTRTVSRRQGSGNAHWQQIVGNENWGPEMINRLYSLASTEMREMLYTSLSTQVNAAQLAQIPEENLLRDSQIYTRLIQECLIDMNHPQHVVPTSWEDFEQRLQTARNVQLPSRYEVEIDGFLQNTERVKQVKAMFDEMTDKLISRACFDQVKSPTGTYLQ